MPVRESQVYLDVVAPVGEALLHIVKRDQICYISDPRPYSVMGTFTELEDGRYPLAWVAGQPQRPLQYGLRRSSDLNALRPGE